MTTTPKIKKNADVLLARIRYAVFCSQRLENGGLAEGLF